MVEVIYKNKLNNEELKDYFSNWANVFNNPRGNFLCNSYIMIAPCKEYDGSKTLADVYAYHHNKIKLGTFEPDNGCVWNEHGIYAYYPILRFYNELNRIGINFNIGVPNNLSIEPTQNGLYINEETLLKCVRDSYKYINIFEDKS